MTCDNPVFSVASSPHTAFQSVQTGMPLASVIQGYLLVPGEAASLDH